MKNSIFDKYQGTALKILKLNVHKYEIHTYFSSNLRNHNFTRSLAEYCFRSKLQ